ncbi:hypothetical protein E4U55_003086 [Claviceps digitariae]|nr:hypothetical protein E4U55_003086 [Claviceps digitariae]
MVPFESHPQAHRDGVYNLSAGNAALLRPFKDLNWVTACVVAANGRVSRTGTDTRSLPVEFSVVKHGKGPSSPMTKLMTGEQRGVQTRRGNMTRHEWIA